MDCFLLRVGPAIHKIAYDKVELGQLEIQLNSCLVTFRSPVMPNDGESGLIC